MFATFAIETDGRDTAIHVNPGHVTAVVEIDDGKAQIFLTGGSDHIVAENAGTVLRRLQEAYGPIPV